MSRLLLVAALSSAACSKSPNTQAPDAALAEPALAQSAILVKGVGAINRDCRGGICAHNENTDLVRWHDALYLVHRTAASQILGPNSSLHIYRSTDEGATFGQTAVLVAPEGRSPEPGGADAGFGYGDGGYEAPSGRDLRDPHFYAVGDTLHLKALTRLPVNSTCRPSPWSRIRATGRPGVRWSPWRRRASASGASASTRAPTTRRPTRTATVRW